MLEILNIILYIFLFFIGAIIASFINVIIYRLPRKLDFVRGRSFCPSCMNKIHFYDLIPIISWLVLKGRCRECKAKISVRYFLIEVISGVLLILTYLSYGLHINMFLVFAVILILFAITYIDIDYMIIPNSLVLSLIVPAIALIFTMKEVTLLSRLIGFFAISLPLLLISLLIEGAFGGGDIKLMAVAGFILGWKNVLLAFFLAIIIAALYVVFMLIRKKVDKKSQFAFGPFLSIGIIIALLYGVRLIEIYVDFTNNLFI